MVGLTQESPSEDEETPRIDNELMNSLKHTMDDPEIAIYNNNGDLRMTKMERPESADEDDKFRRYGSDSDRGDSAYDGASRDSGRLEYGDSIDEEPQTKWDREKDDNENRNTLEMDEGLYEGARMLNDSQLNGKGRSGIINELVVPELVREEPQKREMTMEQIKEEFMRKNYQSNFSMGDGYCDIDEGEKKFREFQNNMDI